MTKSDHHNLITDIIFDLGKVIVGFDWNITLKKLSQIAPEEVAEFIRRDTPGFMALLADPADCLERGKISFEEFVECFVIIMPSTNGIGNKEK